MNRFFSFSSIILFFLIQNNVNAQSISKNKDGFYGVIRGEKVLIPFKYDSIVSHASLFFVKQNSIGWSLLSLKGKSISSLVFNDFIFSSSNFFAFNQSGKWGIASIEGKIINKPIYKSIYWKENEKKWEAISFNQYWLVKHEDTITRFEVDSLVTLNYTTYKYKINSKWGICNINGNIITSTLFDSIDLFNKDLFIFSHYEKKGLIDTLGKIKVNAEYDTFFIEKNSDNFIGIRSDSTHGWELFDGEGNKITKKTYNQIGSSSINYCWRVREGKKYGLINSTGIEIISPIFEWIDPIENKYIIKEKGLVGISDKDLNWLFSPMADSIIYFPNHHFLLITKNQSHLLDINGKELFCITGNFLDTKDHLIRYKNKNRVGLINSEGIELAIPIYDSVSLAQIHDHVIWLFNKNVLTIIDENCNTVLKPDSSIKEIHFNNQDFISVKIKGKYGFVDSRGRLRIANQYEGVQPFSDDMAAIKLKGKWGFVNRAERLKVQPYYDKVFGFKEDAGMIYKEEKYGFVNKNGEEVTHGKYDSILYHSNNHLYISFLNGKKGIINRKGGESIYAKYNQVIPITKDKIIIEKNNQWGVVSITDLMLIPFVYDLIDYNPYSNTFILRKNGKEMKIQ